MSLLTCIQENCEEPPKGPYAKFCEAHWRQRLSEGAAGRPTPTGSRIVRRDGYVYVQMKEGPRVAEHRLIMEEKIGRPLGKGESVHHINGIRRDNRPENLELWVGPIRYGQRAQDVVCWNCKERYSDDPTLSPGQ